MGTTRTQLLRTVWSAMGYASDALTLPPSAPDATRICRDSYRALAVSASLGSTMTLPIQSVSLARTTVITAQLCLLVESAVWAHIGYWIRGYVSAVLGIMTMGCHWCAWLARLSASSAPTMPYALPVTQPCSEP